jgi:biotin synthase-related radical SAM superfamily protein
MLIRCKPLQESCPNNTGLPEQVRLSTGTAIVIGLLKGKLDAEPTTAYLMTYKTGKCSANCGFCPQAKGSQSSAELLCRVTWPNYPTANVLDALSNATEEGIIKRVCIQALNYPAVFLHLEALVKQIRHRSNVPISVSCQPHNTQNIMVLAEAGVNRLGIALDAASEAIFERVKGSGAGGPYSWLNQFHQLEEALAIFGKGNVSTHLILGLGETEKDVLNVSQRCVDLGVLPALFAFTPIRGTALEKKSQPSVASYRRVQLARHIIVHGLSRFEDMAFKGSGELTGFGLDKETLTRLIEQGTAFQTSGCPDCNRPFYNEKPSGPLYNYPRKVTQKEIEEIKKLLCF